MSERSGDTSGGEGYLLGNRQPAAAARLAALSRVFDPVSRRHLVDLGLAPGWRCWEVGAGGPGLAGWLSARVRPAGDVLATDVDLSAMPAGTGFRVRRHDVGGEPPPEGDFDLVHARLVLGHVPAREQALRWLAGALRAGGWLLVEEADADLQPLACPDGDTPEAALANRVKDAFRALMRGRGADLAYGRTLPRQLRSLGLVDVQADAYFPLSGSPVSRLEELTIRQIRPQLVGSGLVTEAELDRHARNVAAGRVDVATAPLVSAWGRRV